MLFLISSCIVEQLTFLCCLLKSQTSLFGMIRSEFIFINPNSKGQCGCGESFMTMSREEATKRGVSSGT